MNKNIEAEAMQVLIALEAIVSAKNELSFIEVDYSVEACEAAAQISGCDATFCKMLNRQFREDAAALMMGRAA